MCYTLGICSKIILGGDRMSKKKSLFREGYSISDALYNAKRSEVTQEAIASFVFLLIGLIIIIISFVKYFNITNAAQEPSDNVNANAWLIFAAVGAVIGVIGLINAVKSLTSFSGIASSIKGMMSKASPFQARPVNRGVAAMNQSQSMSNAPSKGMADKDKAVGYKGMMKKLRKSDDSSSGAGKTYDKYNGIQTQSAPRKNPSPQSQPPSMVQKFDYGIDEVNKKSFADKFLEENKRDPFEEYRRELGIEQAPKKEKEAKPQFIISNRAPASNLTYGMSQESISKQSQSDSQIKQQTVSPVIPVNNSIESTEHIPQLKENGDTALKTSYNSPKQINLTKSETASVSKDFFPQYTIPSVKSENDDFFLSFGKHTQVSVTQQQISHVEKKDALSKESNNISSSDENEFFLNYQPSSDIDIDTYDLSQFDDLSSSPKVNKNPVSDSVFDEQPSSVKNTKNINLSYGFEKTSNSGVPATNRNRVISEEPTLSYNFGNPIKNIDEVMRIAGLDLKPLEDTKTAETTQQKNPHNEKLKSESTVKTDATLKSTSDNRIGTKTTTQTDKNKTVEVSDKSKKNNASQDCSQANKYNFDAFSERKSKESYHTEVEKNTKTKQGKFNFSFLISKFELLKTKGKNKKSDIKDINQKTDTKTNANHEICTNGTKSQRKFVDASEYDEWSCPTCGKVNQEYVGVCCCGTRKPRVK